MPEEIKDAKPTDDSSTLEGAIASSPEAQQQAQDTQTPPAEQGVSQEQGQQQQQAVQPEPPFHEHPRFKEIVDEKNYWREMAMKLQQQPTQQPLTPKQPEVMGNTPEEREFWRQVDDRARIQAEKIRQETQPQIQAAQQEFARMKVVEFRRSHPDIKPNTPDEVEIAGLIRTGYDPDHAYWAVMGPRGVQTARQQATQQVKQQMQVKRQANVEGQGVPAQSGLPSQKVSFRDDVDKRMREAGI